MSNSAEVPPATVITADHLSSAAGSSPELLGAAGSGQANVGGWPVAFAPPPPPGGYRLLLPTIAVEAPIVEVGLDADGAMGAPNGPDEVGWFAAGARPGGPGNVLMDGHVDWADRKTGIARTAVFWNLKDLEIGQEMIVVAGPARFVYRVIETTRLPYDDPDAGRFLASGPAPLLTLITCEGNFNSSAHNYSHRRIVVAELARTEQS